MAIASLIFAFIGLIPDRSGHERYEDELSDLLLQAAQELRYNSDWLTAIAVAYDEKKSPLPIGRMKVNALVELANRELERIVQWSYGEEKYIYQEIYRLSDLAVASGSPKARSAVASFNSSSDYTLHDVIFLNNFLWWYLTPVAQEALSRTELYSLGWKPFPGREFRVPGVSELSLRRFMDGDEPILDFDHYLGLLD